jgi:hypothetical protein
MLKGSNKSPILFHNSLIPIPLRYESKRKAKIVGRSKRMNNSQGSDNEQIMNDNNTISN